MMSEDIRSYQKGDGLVHCKIDLGESGQYPTQSDEGEDYVDLGAAVLEFYSSLVDLLGKCAPDLHQLQSGKGESLRARAILRSLISLEDLEAILRIRFPIPNINGDWSEGSEGSMPPGLTPIHKRSVLLFLDRVYSIDTQEMFFRLLEQAFLPDLRTACILDQPPANETDIAYALNRYLCNNVLPLLTRYSYFFADADHAESLLDATLHTVYRMNQIKALTNNQLHSVSDFLIAITRELPPIMMVKLMKKVIVDIPDLNQSSITPLLIMTLHYERCNRYYGAGNNFGQATDLEKRLSMNLFSAIFDSLGTKPYDPDLFSRALPCLTNIASALSPDYTLSSDSAEDDDSVNVQRIKSSAGGVWSPDPIDVSGVNMSNELNAMTLKFAEHFHDSWASRKLDKGWTHGDVYSRVEKTHSRLKPFTMLSDEEKNFYKERCAECVRAALGMGYKIELADPDAKERGAQASGTSGSNIQSYNPRPVDLANMTLDTDMQALAEKTAENSHLIAAKTTIEHLGDSGDNMPLSLVPWDLLTDVERRKDRFRSHEVIKFFQYHGFRFINMNIREDANAAKTTEMEGRSIEKRFAYNLLEKLLRYVDQAGVRMKVLRPSQDVTRRSSFKHTSKDVQFFEKVVLPIMHAYFVSHRNYFMAGSASGGGNASDREKEMLASLFCRLAYMIRMKRPAFGTNAKLTIECLTAIIRSLDLKCLVKINSDVVRTSLLTFFNNQASDLKSAVDEYHANGQYASIRGGTIKSWTSLEFSCQITIPILTNLYNHLANSNFGTDLLVEDIQAACYKILNSLYYLAKIAKEHKERVSIQTEIEKHRPSLGGCLSAFARCFPVAFLEPHFNSNNKYSVLAKWAEHGSVAVQEMMQSLAASIPTLDQLIQHIEESSKAKVTYGENPNIFDVDVPLICSYLRYWWDYGPEGQEKTERQVTEVIAEHCNRVFIAVMRIIRDSVGCDDAPWMGRMPLFVRQIIQIVNTDPVPDYFAPTIEKQRVCAEEAHALEERMKTHPDDVDENAVGEKHAHLVRDVYSIFPILIKYTDLHRPQWLKSPSKETDSVYENVAVIFKIWFRSQHFKREELNFMTQFSDESDPSEQALTPQTQHSGRQGAAASRHKRKREGQSKKSKHANSTVIKCFKRLLPVGLNIFGGRELDIVQQTKEKFLKDENEDKIREFIRALLEIPEKTDPTDERVWQRNLYRKIGKSQMRGVDEMNREVVVNKISNMGQVLSILHSVENPSLMSEVFQKVVSSQRKRAVVACFRTVPIYSMPRSVTECTGPETSFIEKYLYTN